jgi:hypothetical protein
MADDDDDFEDIGRAMSGLPPKHWYQVSGMAGLLADIIKASPALSGCQEIVQVLLATAFAHYMTAVPGRSPSGFVPMCRRVAQWSDQAHRAAPGNVPAELENQSLELSHAITHRLTRDQRFLLLVVGGSTDDGYRVHISNLSTSDQMKVVARHMDELRAEELAQQKMS